MQFLLDLILMEFNSKKDFIFLYFCEVFGFLENFGVKIDWNYFCLGEVVVMAKQV